MAHPTSSQVTPSSAGTARPLPTGPKALRTPASGPSQSPARPVQGIARPVPAGPSSAYGYGASGPGLNGVASRGGYGGFDNRRGINHGPPIPSFARHLNGYPTGPAGFQQPISGFPAESSKQAWQQQSQAYPTPSYPNGLTTSTSYPLGPSAASAYPNGITSAIPYPAGPSKSPSTSSRPGAVAKSPVKSASSSRKPIKSPTKYPEKSSFKEFDPDYKSKLLPTTNTARPLISISLSGINTNGKAPQGKGKLPLENRSNGISINGRPPTPPPPDDLLPPPPPPPSPPPESSDYPPSPPPPPPTEPSSPGVPPPPDLPSRSPSPKPDPKRHLFETDPAPAPPSFHFRNLPIPRRSPTPDEDSDENESSASGSGSEAEGSDISRRSRGSSPRQRRLPSTTPPPLPEEEPTPPPPPWSAPLYIPPPSVGRRSIGNYKVLQDPATDRGVKDLIKRMDGIHEGQEVIPVDPRIEVALEVRTKGKGNMKNRSTVMALEYEWDENSTGPKPPPPPCAVLITGLSPLTTVDQISKHLKPFGRIRTIDAKMDPKSGMQLGICWVKFEGPLPGRPGTGFDVVNQVVKMCDGQRIGLNDSKPRVVLDGRGLRAEKAVKEEMERKYPPKPKVVPPPPPPAISTPSSAGAQTPRTDNTLNVGLLNRPSSSSSSLPSGPSRPTISKPLHTPIPSRPVVRPTMAYNTMNRNYASLNRSLPVRPLAPMLSSRPMTNSSTQHLNSSFISAPFSRHRYDDLRDSYSPRRSRSSSRSSYTSLSDSEDDRPAYRSRARSPVYRDYRDRRRSPVGVVGSRGRRGPDTENREKDEKEVERVREALTSNGHAYVFIDAKSLPTGPATEDHVRDHFRAFKPSQVLVNHVGWYILFHDDATPYRAQRVLDKTAVQGHRIGLVVRTPPSAKKVEDAKVPVNDHDREKGWKFLTITKKNRIRKPSPKAVARRRSISFSSESEVEAPVKRSSPSRSARSSSSEVSDDEILSRPVQSKRIRSASPSDDDVSPVLPTDSMDVEGEEEIEVLKPTKQIAKPKAKKPSKKVRVTSPAVDIVPDIVPPVEDIKIEPVPAKKARVPKVPKAPKAPKAAKATRRAATPPGDRFLATAGVEDDEDAYWLSQALASVRDEFEPDFSSDEEEVDDPKHPLYHTSGSWRAEGWKKIPQIQKSSYLPQRNRAAVSAEEATALTTGRQARVSGRRLANDMDTHRKTVATVSSATVESDLFAFNQLRIRKKQLRFARSAIEGYGLYAMETIHIGEMVCEYVGEICRSAVADIREQRYLKQGIGSSYLFRIDADSVCDATFKGSVSRLINHSCDPSASAKIISINGQQKIVIYAKRTLYPGEEILYDYKFPLESDPALRVPCLCGSPVCRGWLN